MRNILIKNILLAFLLSILMLGCNTAEQEQLSDRAIEATTGVSNTSFDYNATTLELIQNTTYVSIFPVGEYDGASFTIDPSLPDGLSIRITTGEISGTPTETITKTSYSISAIDGSDIKTSSITIEISDEPPKTINYPISNLLFTKDESGTTYTPTTTGGSVTSYSIDKTLPSGLSLNSLTGIIFGTPTESGSDYYTVTASNTEGSAEIGFNIVIADSAPEGLDYVADGNDEQDINVNDDFDSMQAALTNDPDSVTYSIAPSLPTGLIIDSESGEISGTPTATNGVKDYTVTAKNSSGSTTTEITINIKNPPTLLEYAESATEQQIQTGVEISAIKVSAYTGGSPVTYSCDVTNICPAGLTIDSSTGTITGAPTDNATIVTTDILATHTVYDIAGTGTDVSTSATIVFHIVDDYPEGNTLGYESSYQLYENVAVTADSIIPQETNGSADIYAISPEISTVITGLTFDTTTGEISGTPTTSPITETFTITGKNDDQTGGDNNNISTVQLVSITVGALTPVMLGYNSGGSPSFYNSENDSYEFVDGVSQSINPCFTDTTPAADCIGGHPTDYYISPGLPDGLNLEQSTGEISGTPSEITSLKYYTITAENSAGTYKETIAISTNTLIAPTYLTYNDDDTECSTIPAGTGNTMSVSINAIVSEEPCYSGSQATFAITPDLPLGLSINSTTGVISGTPLESNSSGVNDTYIVKVSNALGSLSTTITMSVADLVVPSNLVYTDSDLNTSIELTEEDTLSSSNVLHTSDYDTDPSVGGYISDYTMTATYNIGGAAAFATYDSESEDYTEGTMSYNRYTGDMSGTAQATDPGDLNPGGIDFSITPTNSQGAGAVETFNFIVKEKAPIITYEDSVYGDNTIIIQGGMSSTFTPANTGGNIATLNAGAAYSSGCTATVSSTKEGEAYDINTAGDFTFNSSTCEISYNYTSQCFSDDTNANGSTGDTIVFDINAKNSGNTSGAVTQLTVHFYDKPNFTFSPDTEFADENLIVLDGGQASDSYAPTLGSCHQGEFALTTESDLPPQFTFDSTTGTIASSEVSILGRLSFHLAATETGSGYNFNSAQNIEVQANYIEVQDGNISERFESQLFDLNLDGKEDLILRSTNCDAEGCTTEEANTVLLLQDSDTVGLLLASDSNLPTLTNIKAKAILPIQYDASKAGIIYVSEDGSTITAQSTTDSESDSESITEYDSPGDIQGLVSGQSGITEKFAHIQEDDTNNAIKISEFTVDSTSLDTITAGTVRTVSDASSGGADIESISLVRQSSPDNDSNNSAFIAYNEHTTGEEKICILAFDGTDFETECSGEITMPDPTLDKVKEMKFSDIDDDGLDDLYVLVDKTGGSNAHIYIYENKTDTTTGLYSLVSTIDLGVVYQYTDFALADIDDDNYADITVNNIFGDIDDDDTADTHINGVTTYYHTGDTSAPYDTTLKSLKDHPFYYSQSAGDTNQVELIANGDYLLLFHCQIDTETTITAGTNSGCGIVGSF